MKIEVLKSKHSKLFFDEYCRYFKKTKMPYATRISPDFFKNRIINSTLYKTDCSVILLSDSGDFYGLAIANLNANPIQKNSKQLFLNLFFAKPTYELKLINHILAIAKENNCEKMITSLQWNGVWAGIPTHWHDTISIFKQSGGRIKTGELYLELELDSFAVNVNPSLGGYEIVFYKPAYFEALKKVLADNFSIGWQYEVLSKVNMEIEPFNGYGLGKTYNPKDVMLMKKGNEICGFCIVQSQTNNDTAFFGPIGLAIEHRGQGLGHFLLQSSLEYLKSLGKLQLGLWTNYEIYQRFYKPMGFYKKCETVHFEWIL